MARTPKQRRAGARHRLLQIVIVIGMAGAIILTLWMMRAPAERLVAFDNPNEITSTTLIENPERFEGEIVTFMGEVIGERMLRGDHGAWIHLNDDPYMFHDTTEGALLSGYNTGMAIWVVEGWRTDAIEYYGAYRMNGDIVKVTGVFNGACSEHGGDIDIHATTVEIVQSGHTTPGSVDSWKPLLAGFLLVMAALMYMLNRLSARRELAGIFGHSRDSERD